MGHITAAVRMHKQCLSFLHSSFLREGVASFRPAHPSALGLLVAFFRCFFSLDILLQMNFLVHPLFGPDDLGLEVEGSALGLIVDVEEVLVVGGELLLIPDIRDVQDVLGLVEVDAHAGRFGGARSGI